MASKPEMPAEPAEPTVPVEFAQNIEMSLRNMLLALTRPEILAAPQTGPGADSAALASCQVESMGDATDSDGDNYPVAETRTFACDVVFISGTASLVLMDKGRCRPRQRGQGGGNLGIQLLRWRRTGPLVHRGCDAGSQQV